MVVRFVWVIIVSPDYVKLGLVGLGLCGQVRFGLGVVVLRVWLR